MEAPKWVCTELERIHPKVRLGWLGRDKGTDEELNQGSFYLLQLYHQSDLESCFSELWNDVGPIFGSDYDRLSWFPAMVAEVSPQDVYSGAVLKALRVMLTPAKERIYQQRLDLGEALEDSVKDMAGEMGEEMHWRAQKSYDRPQVMAKKFMTEEDKATLRGERKKDLSQTFMPSKNGGGF